MGGPGLDRTDDFQRFCRRGLDRIYFFSDQDWTRTEKFHSPLISATQGSTYSETDTTVHRHSNKVGRLDDLMVFHQTFVTKEPVNICCLCKTLLLNYAIASAVAYILRNASTIY